MTTVSPTPSFDDLNLPSMPAASPAPATAAQKPRARAGSHRAVFVALITILASGCATHPHYCEAPVATAGQATIVYDRTSLYNSEGQSAYCGLHREVGRYATLEKFDIDGGGSGWTSPEAGSAAVPAGRGTITYSCGERWLEAGTLKHFGKMIWNAPVSLAPGKTYRLQFAGWGTATRCTGDPASAGDAIGNYMSNPGCAGQNSVSSDMCSARLVEVRSSGSSSQ